jgi:pimeloyl-ACP methyl ester carboxylesterase
MTRAEIQAVYDAGPEAVGALVERLLATIDQQQSCVRALAARVKQLETATPTRPLVFVPGILASQLWDQETGTRIWPPVGWQESGRLAARPLRLLVTVPSKTAHLLFPGLHDELLKSIHDLGYHEDIQPQKPRNLWVFVYDWTRSNRDSGRELAAFITRDVLKTHNSLHPEDPWNDVDVVSHSMGGLVTRAAIKLFQAPIQRAVYIASPHYGAPLAYFALHSRVGLTRTLGLFVSVAGHAMWERFLRQPGDRQRLDEQLHWVATQLPSVYELLPDEFYLTDRHPMVILQSGLISTAVIGPADTYWVNPSSRFLDPTQCKRAEEAMTFKRQLGSELPEKKLVLYSDTEVTPDQVICRWNRFGRPHDSGQHGDDTVPAASASAGQTDARRVEGTHEGLPNTWATHRLIAQFLGDA